MIGTYLHGLFGNEHIWHALMSYLHERKGIEYAPQVEDWGLDAYEELVDVVRKNVGVWRICGIMGIDVWVVVKFCVVSVFRFFML